MVLDGFVIWFRGPCVFGFGLWFLGYWAEFTTCCAQMKSLNWVLDNKL